MKIQGVSVRYTGIHALLGVTLLLLTAGCATGKPANPSYFSIYGGGNSTQNDNLKAKETIDGMAPTRIVRRIDFHDSQTFGIRGGGWFSEAPWLGIAGDLSGFRAEGDVLRDADIMALSILLIARARLFPSDEHPDGRLRPYVAAGPALFLTDGMVDLQPTFARRVGESPFDVAAGYDLRAGVEVPVHGKVSMFFEFRYTHFRGGFDDQEGGDFFSDPRATRKFEQRFRTRHWLFGFSMPFGSPNPAVPKRRAVEIHST